MKNLFTCLLLFVSSWSLGQSGVVSSRLAEISTSGVELSYNGYVQTAIDEILLNKVKATDVLSKSDKYLELIEDSLRAHNLPPELKFLVPAFSQYDNWKISPDGGSGFWQLRYITARRYGLRISSYVDERRDLPKATSAAIDYLKYLHSVFNDWHAVMAAFSGDETEVKKAMRMAGGDTSYWNYHRFLPLKYQQAVPDYIAQVYVHSYFKELGLELHNIEEIEYTLVPIDQWVTLYQLSKALEVDFELLKDANAIYKKHVIPNTDKTYYVNIPSDKKKRFDELGDSIYVYQTHPQVEGQVEPQTPTVEQPKVEEPAEKPVVQQGPRVIYYTVCKGDYLGRIADLYDVRISDVKKWNNLRSDQINVNQRLKIYKPASVYTKYNKINGMSAAQKNQLIRKD